MQISLSRSELKEYIKLQLDHFFPDRYQFVGNDIDRALELALERTEKCFSYINIPAYSTKDGNVFFSHLHTDQYAVFLYYLSNSLWKISENKPICDKLIFLNKALSGCYYSYKGELPDIFLLTHPTGTVIGNAVYSDFLVVSQNVTINTGIDSKGNAAPKLGKGLYLAAGAKIIGTESIGKRVSVGVDTVIYNQVIGDDKVAIKLPSGEVQIRERLKKNCKAQQYFNVTIE